MLALYKEQYFKIDEYKIILKENKEEQEPQESWAGGGGTFVLDLDHVGCDPGFFHRSLNQRAELRVDNHELAVGMLEDVADSFRLQPRVDRA